MSRTTQTREHPVVVGCGNQAVDLNALLNSGAVSRPGKGIGRGTALSSEAQPHPVGPVPCIPNGLPDQMFSTTPAFSAPAASEHLPHLPRGPAQTLGPRRDQPIPPNGEMPRYVSSIATSLGNLLAPPPMSYPSSSGCGAQGASGTSCSYSGYPQHGAGGASGTSCPYCGNGTQMGPIPAGNIGMAGMAGYRDMVGSHFSSTLPTNMPHL